MVNVACVSMDHRRQEESSAVAWVCIRVPCHRKCQRSKSQSSCVWRRSVAVALCLLFLFQESRPVGGKLASKTGFYTNQWAVKVVGGLDKADSIAARHGFVNIGQIIPPYYYLFISRRLRRNKRSSRNSKYLQLALAKEPEVQWIAQQKSKRRVKRDFQYPNDASFKSYYQSAGSDSPDDGNLSRPNDPLWPQMWYLHRGGPGTGLDHNVQEAWELGITGKDIVVTILDDGLEKSHPDLRANYDPLASFDINDHDEDPSPRYDITNENRHGTRCAGEVAAVFNNTECIVGIAFNARIGGIRMLDGDVTDAVEAASLSHNRDHVDIYSASWGPDDDGRTVDGPARLARLAFDHGIRSGRRNKGSIFIWASGNGGRDADSCNCDGYTNSIYTLSISSATENGNVPWYSEACSSTLATTYSSGSHGERMIVTTDLHHSCTESHTGTSASAPLAAGICALALEANPELTWRDLQHILVRTARPERLRGSDWIRNGVGRNVSHSFGFGLMDAGAMVRLAKNWTNAPPQRRCVITYPGRYKSIPHGSRLHVSLESDGCANSQNRIRYLEHVQARITLTAPKRGDIQVFLTSPSGTRSTLLAKRARDTSRAGFRDWAFMTTHNWGEKSGGKWHLEIDNDGWADANLLKWDLVLYGTESVVGEFGGTPSGASSRPLSCRYFSAFGLCIGCDSGFVLFGHKCEKRCPDQYYRNGTNCHLCPALCTKCVGPYPSCSRCLPGYSVSGGYCVRGKIPPRQSADSITVLLYCLITGAFLVFLMGIGVLVAVFILPTKRPKTGMTKFNMGNWFSVTHSPSSNNYLPVLEKWSTSDSETEN